MQPGEIDITGHLTNDNNLEKSRKFADILDYARKVAPGIAWELYLDPDDLFQEFSLKLVKSKRSLDDVRDVPAWTYTSMRNTGLNIVRHLKRERNSTEPLEWDEGDSKEGDARKGTAEWYRATADALEGMLADERRSEVQSIIRRIACPFLEPLSKRDRKIVFLTWIGVRTPDIAKHTDLSKSHIYRLNKPAAKILKRIVKKLGLQIELLEDPELEGALSDLVLRSIPEDLLGEYAYAA